MRCDNLKLQVPAYLCPFSCLMFLISWSGLWIFVLHILQKFSTPLGWDPAGLDALNAELQVKETHTMVQSMRAEVSALVPISKGNCSLPCRRCGSDYDWCNIRQDMRALISFGLGAVLCALLCGWARCKESNSRDQMDPLERVQLFAYMM